MNTVQLYKNPYPYPTYTRTLTKYKDPFQATPRNMNLRAGYIDLPLTFADVNNCNYLSFTRDGMTVYAWITEAEEIGGNNRFRLKYNTDALRTFLPKVNLGVQYVERGPTPTLLYDELLGSSDPFPEVIVNELTFGHPNRRVMVVQAHPQDAVGEDYSTSNTPVHPTLYDFYLKEYNVTNPLATPAINEFFSLCREYDPYLIVTVYSIPWVSTEGLTPAVLPINNEGYYAEGWGKIPSSGPQSDRFGYTQILSVPEGLTQIDSSYTIVIPTAGVLRVPIELLQFDYIYLRRDIDVFTGLVNYQLVDDHDMPYGHSIRGGSVNTIPIIGDPLETYLSQNQNALSTAVIGDVATIAGGAVMAATGAGALAGGSMMLVGARNLITRQAQIKDAGTSYSNPPAFLGSALAHKYTDRFYTVIKKSKVDNSHLVHAEKGYPQNRLMNLSLPTAGFIQTRNCAVSGAIPQWAIDEINARFDGGLLVK